MEQASAGLELETHPRFVTVERTVQRVGIGVMTVFVLAGALGLFGDGPLSTVSARTGSLTVTYQRFTRQSVRSTLTVEAASAGVARIGFDKDFVEQMAIHETRPLGLETQEEPEQVVFLVPSSNGIAKLVLRVEPLQPGVHQARVTTQDGGAVELRQVVFF